MDLKCLAYGSSANYDLTDLIELAGTAKDISVNFLRILIVWDYYAIFHKMIEGHSWDLKIYLSLTGSWVRLGLPESHEMCEQFLVEMPMKNNREAAGWLRKISDTCGREEL